MMTQTRPFHAISCFASATLGMLLLLATTWAKAQADEYRLDQGDVVEITFSGPLDARQRSAIDVNGELTVPLLGPVKAAGLGVAQLRETIQKQLPKKTFRKRTPDGRETLAVLDPNEIGVEVVEYRPLYVTGDVARPGQQVFRPGMTVLQAVALSGGYELVRLKMENPFLQIADYQVDFQTTWSEIARAEARALRLVAERQGRRDVDYKKLYAMPVPRELVEQIVTLETGQLQTSLGDYEKEKRSFEQEMKLTDSRLSVLASQQQEQERSVRDQEREIDRLRGLADKSLLTAPRMVDAQRVLSLSAERVFQTEAEAERAKRERETLNRQYNKMLEQRMLKLQADLQDAQVRIAALRNRVQGVSEKLLYSGIVKSQLTAATPPRITITRKSDAGVLAFAADETSQLRPGDVVSVALQVAELGAQPSAPASAKPVAQGSAAPTLLSQRGE